jgi:predicted PurR-regulated permease PerM
LSFLSEPLTKLQSALERLRGLAPGSQHPITVDSNPLPDRVLSGVRVLASGAFTTLLLLFFLLSAGDVFLRRLVEILPRFKDKRQAVDISQQIEHDISVYLATITMMNLVVGVLTGIAMWLLGLGSPLLWGTVAFLLNYVPVLGPAAGVVLFLITGLVMTDTLWGALLPPGLYLLIHIAEGETITPMLLARRFTINPVLVILSLIFWYWMWGVAGAILSTPMLAITKIVCDRIESLKPVGHFIEG